MVRNSSTEPRNAYCMPLIDYGRLDFFISALGLRYCSRRRCRRAPMLRSISCIIALIAMANAARASERCTFDSNGRCEPHATRLPRLQLAQQGTNVQWGSIAAGLLEGNPARVGTGSAIGDTPEEAARAAVQACEDAVPAAITCNTIRTFSKGCWYVANGTRGTQTRYASGRTWDEAFEQCQEDGFTCRTKVIGGCVNEDFEENENDE